MADILTATLVMTLLACALDRAFGYPQAVFVRIGHPVTWMGALITRLERYWNIGTPAARRASGRVLVVVLLVTVLAVTLPLQALAGWLVLGLLGSSLIAQRSLAQHVAAVADGLERSLDDGRMAVSMIVGRDVAVLDEGGVARAAVESLAENFSDGIVAPVFWMAIAGLPGAAAYKAINTADSMIGHRTDRYLHFGRFAARLDDVANWPAARLTGALLVAAAALMPGASSRAAWAAMRSDARHHKSPNAGWPEAALAGALGFSLAGPRAYDGLMTDDRAMNPAGRRDLDAADIRRALRLYWIADALLVGLIGAGALTLIML